MEILKSLRTTTFSLLISLSLLLLHLSLAASFSPRDHYLFDCGSTSSTTVDLDNRRFTNESSTDSFSLFSSPAPTILLRDQNPSPNSSPIYHTARVFKTSSYHSFKIRDKGTHLVRLHFYKFDDSNSKFFNSQFHVSANGYVLLSNFSVMNSHTPVIKDYLIWVDSDELEIMFTPSKKSNYAFVNAIEVISAPKDLIADVGMLVSCEKVVKIDGLMKNAFETVYRVNVGGRKVTPFNDSLWRTWVPDDEFLKSSDGSKSIYFGGRIKYRMGGASREVAPDNVYNSARVISSSNESVPHLNISWEFPVIGGYKYLVRLHFCDIASISIGLLYFNVYVNGKLAYENLDLSSITTWVLASPFYADFVVDMGSTGVLTVSVGPSNMSMPHTIDAILNGVEIMKMNNSMGSLDGEVSVESISNSWRTSHIDAGVLFIGAVCLLVIASLLTLRRRVGAKDSFAWSRLPVSEINLNCGIKQPSSGKV